MLGEFSYKKVPEGWQVSHTSATFGLTMTPVCVVTKDPGNGGWDNPDSSGGLYQTRFKAAYAYLEKTWNAEGDRLDDLFKKETHTNPPRNRTLTTDEALALWEVFAENFKTRVAPDNDASGLRQFLHYQTGPNPSGEHRIGGLLGYGGKFWNEERRWVVTIYDPRQHPVERLIVARTNLLLQKMFRASCGGDK